MSVTFAVRGDSLTPRYNGVGGPGYGFNAATDPASIVDAGAIGGYTLDLGTTGNLNRHQVHYNGVGNWPTTKAFSLLMRFYVYDNTDSNNLFMCSGPGRLGNYGAGNFQVTGDATNFRFAMTTATGLTGINNVTIAHGGLTNATYYDLFFTFTGDNTTNGCEVFLDATSLGTTTSTRNWEDPRLDINRSLVLGANNNSTSTYIRVNEFVLWSGIEDPTSIGLTSGSGSLNGASRTAFVDVDAYDGAASSGGGASKITMGGNGFNC